MWAQESDMGVGFGEAGWQEIKREVGGKDVIEWWHRRVGTEDEESSASSQIHVSLTLNPWARPGPRCTSQGWTIAAVVMNSPYKASSPAGQGGERQRKSEKQSGQRGERRNKEDLAALSYKPWSSLFEDREAETKLGCRKVPQRRVLKLGFKKDLQAQ